MANSMGYHIVGPTAWATIHMGELVQEDKQQFNCGPDPPSTSCVWRLKSEVLFLPIIFSYSPTQVFGTSKPSTFPTRKLFFLLSEEYLEKN